MTYKQLLAMNRDTKTILLGTLALASALIAKGATLEGVNKLGYSQAEFIINGYDLNSEVIEFQNRNLKVDAMTLFENHKSLKARTNDVMRNSY